MLFTPFTISSVALVNDTDVFNLQPTVENLTQRIPFRAITNTLHNLLVLAALIILLAPEISITCATLFEILLSKVIL